MGSDDGRAGAPPLWPGLYRVELCADPECAAVLAAWNSVTVISGQTLSLTARPSPR